MAYLLDTNVAIALRDGDVAILDGVNSLEAGVMISIVTRVELEGGVHRDPNFTAECRMRLDILLRSTPCLAFDEHSAAAYATIVKQCGYSRGKLLDRMIAAQAIVHRAVLVTRNASDFSDIPGLQTLGW